jgi:polyferredoxin
MQQQICLARRPRLRTRFDIVPWLAAAVVVVLVVLFAVPRFAAVLGHPLPGRIAGRIGLAVWWTYWGSVVFFGLVVMRRWRNTHFRWRTLATMASQTLFGIILIGPLSGVLHIPPFWRRLHLTWPLHMSAITPHLEKTLFPAFVYGVIASLIAWPLLTRYLGMRYCSWFCFCGNLAENLGDSFRTKGPKGPDRQGLDHVGYIVLALATGTTAVLWLGITWPYAWYDLIVGLVIADVVGIGTYLVLGSRVWCRFFCPLRAMLGWHSRRGRFAIYTSEHRCIECGTCNRYCEMGIDIRQRARQGIPMRDTECVACGACIAVCPRYALSFYPFPSAQESTSALNHRRFRRPFVRQLATPRER